MKTIRTRLFGYEYFFRVRITTQRRPSIPWIAASSVLVSRDMICTTCIHAILITPVYPRRVWHGHEIKCSPKDTVVASRPDVKMKPRNIANPIHICSLEIATKVHGRVPAYITPNAGGHGTTSSRTGTVSCHARRSVTVKATAVSLFPVTFVCRYHERVISPIYSTHVIRVRFPMAEVHWRCRKRSSAVAPPSCSR